MSKQFRKRSGDWFNVWQSKCILCLHFIQTFSIKVDFKMNLKLCKEFVILRQFYSVSLLNTGNDTEIGKCIATTVFFQALICNNMRVII